MVPSGWKQMRLDSLASVERGKFSARPRNDPKYFGGEIPFVQTGDVANSQLYLANHSQTLNPLGVTVSKVFEEGTILLTIAANIGATAITRVPTACPDSLVGIRPLSEVVDLLWLKYALADRQKDLDIQAGQNAQKNINLEVLKPLRIATPPLAEQRRIGEMLFIWDQAIATVEQLLANSRNQKLLLSQQLLTGKTRLKGFANSGGKQETPYGPLPIEWEYRRIGEMAAEVSQKLGDSEPYPVLSCTKHKGLVDSLAYFNKQVFSIDTSTYKVAPRGCFVYATNHIDEGSIGYQDLYEFGLVSPMYTVFKTDNNVDDTYFYALLKTEHYRQIFASATNASVDRRGSLRWKDFRNLHVPLPSVEEQRAIANMLAMAGRKTDLIQAQLNLLRDEKAALMSQLLTGKRRVKVPEVEAELQA